MSLKKYELESSDYLSSWMTYAIISIKAETIFHIYRNEERVKWGFVMINFGI